MQFFLFFYCYLRRWRRSAGCWTLHQFHHGAASRQAQAVPQCHTLLPSHVRPTRAPQAQHYPITHPVYTTCELCTVLIDKMDISFMWTALLMTERSSSSFPLLHLSIEVERASLRVSLMIRTMHVTHVTGSDQMPVKAPSLSLASVLRSMPLSPAFPGQTISVVQTRIKVRTFCRSTAGVTLVILGRGALVLLRFVPQVC